MSDGQLVILTAFGRRLRSEPLEWPANLAEYLYIPWPMDEVGDSPITGLTFISPLKSIRTVKFRYKGGLMIGGVVYREYVLTEMGA